MSGSITDANYVILGNSQSKTYQDLLAQATAANKLPLRHIFIADCVKYEGLLDQNDYVLEDYVPPKKRPRTSTAATVKVERLKKEKKEKVKAAPKKTADSIAHNGPPSPSPPPSKDRVNFVGGNYLFTAEEIDYFKRLARCLIERDLKVTNTAIMKRLHAKVGSLCYIAITSLTDMNRCLIIRLVLGLPTSPVTTQTNSTICVRRSVSHNEKHLMLKTALEQNKLNRPPITKLDRQRSQAWILLPLSNPWRRRYLRIWKSRISMTYANSSQRAEVKTVMTSKFGRLWKPT